jgi:hypothetical protein
VSAVRDIIAYWLAAMAAMLMWAAGNLASDKGREAIATAILDAIAKSGVPARDLADYIEEKQSQ